MNNTCISDIKNILVLARQKAYTAINNIMVQAYWQIGKRIVEEDQKGNEKATYGDALLKQLSIELTKELGKGFAYSNLKNFRQFFLTYPNLEKGYALRSELTWTHYRLMMRVENTNARNYYLNECAEQRWSTRTLERNINTFYYERILSSQNKQEALLHSANLGKLNPSDFVKDPYILEFLEIPEPYIANEKKIETALIDKLQQFLMELGKGFSFLGRQYRISSETSHFYIDLVFYNYIIKCFVLFDLKSGKLTHQDIGQMDMYIRMFDDLKRTEGDKPTLGIILCTEKDETVVKYSMLKENEQMFATKYLLYLPTEQELIEEIEREKRLISEQQNNNN